MSYQKFIDSWCDKVAELRGSRNDIPREEGLAIQEHAQALVFQDWLEKGRYQDLISYIHSNFDTGGGDEWIHQLSAALVKSKNAALLKTLWRGVIAIRRRHYWSSVDHLSRYPKSDENPPLRKTHVLEALESFREAISPVSDPEIKLWIEEEVSLLLSGKKRKGLKAGDKRSIDELVFWDLIAQAHKDVESSEEVVQNLVRALENFAPPQIRNFEKLFLEKMALCWSWDLWALAYIVRRGCSDDAFDYFRAWVILQGKELFEIAVSDVGEFADRANVEEDPQCESLINVARTAYENAKGEPMRPVKSPPVVRRGKEWEENEIPLLYPRLCTKFNFQ